MREEARRSLRIKRAMHRGLDAVTAELEVAAAELDAWELKKVRPSGAAVVDVPGEMRWADTGRKVARG